MMVKVHEVNELRCQKVTHEKCDKNILQIQKAALHTAKSRVIVIHVL